MPNCERGLASEMDLEKFAAVVVEEGPRAKPHSVDSPPSRKTGQEDGH